MYLENQAPESAQTFRITFSHVSSPAQTERRIRVKKYNRKSTQALKEAAPLMRHSIFSSHNYFSFIAFLLFNKTKDMCSARVIRFHLIKCLGLDFEGERKETREEIPAVFAAAKGKVKYTIGAQHFSKPHPTGSSRPPQLMPTVSHSCEVFVTDSAQVFICQQTWNCCAPQKQATNAKTKKLYVTDHQPI